jgi:hypothetical protein
VTTEVAFIGTLPTELVDMIIDQFRGDNKSLSTCSFGLQEMAFPQSLSLISQVVLAPRDFSAFIASVERPSSPFRADG